jgi:hypothetical protein
MISSKQKIAYDVKLFRPASPTLAETLGANPKASELFDPKHWLTDNTPNLVVAEVNGGELRRLVYFTEAHFNKRQREGT